MPMARLRPACLTAVLIVAVCLPAIALGLTRPYEPSVDLQPGNVFVQAPRSLLVSSSPAGAHLYVVGGPGVVALRRDAATGTVRFIEREDVDPGGLTTGEGAISPDGRHLYVPTTATSPFTGATLSILSRDPVTGQLAGAGGVTVPGGANAAVVSPDGAHVYATGAALSVFARDAVTGALTPVEQQPVAAAAGVDLSPDGLHVYVTSPGDDTISVWERNAATGALTFRGVVSDGVDGADGLDGVTDLVFSPDGSFAYAAGELEDAVGVFARSLATGLLTPVEVQRDGQGGVSGLVRPSGLVVSADGSHLYAAAGPNGPLGAPGATVAFSRDAGTGVLAFVGVLENGGGVEGLGGPAIALSPDGLFVYTAAGPAIAVLGRDPLLGTVSFVQRRSGLGGFGLQGARDLAPSSDGRHVYVASEIDRAVSILRVSSVDGALLFGDAVYQGEQPGISGATTVAATPDDLHVYVASADTGTLATFARDALTGALAYVAEVAEGVDGVAGLADPVALGLNADGTSLYVAGETTGSIAVFARDAGSGQLTFVEEQAEGVGGVTGLTAPRALALSADGTSVYAVGGGGEVAVFARDAGSGALTFVQAVVDGQPGAERLAGARDVAVTPDGTQVLVAAEADSAVVVFARDAGTGVLTPVETIRDVAGVGPLAAPTSVTVHPDGATVLVVAGAALPGFGSPVPSSWAFDRAPDGTIRIANVRPLSDVVRTVRFGPLDDAYAIQIGFGLRMYRFAPGFVGCDPLPRTGCKARADGRSKLAMKVRTPTKPVLKWKWSNGEATFGSDFADVASDGVAWCLYDESGPTPALIARALAPGDALRWRAASTSKVKYKDKGRLPEGVLGILMSASQTSGRAKLKVKGSGPELTIPVPPLPLPLRVQLQARSACWESTFSGAGARRNDSGQLIANAD